MKLRVKSDSISALILVLKLKTAGTGPAVIAREMALDMASALYTPSVVAHLPGVANITADLLSRLGDQLQRSLDDARRLARLLISEIKLYNEKKVDEGRASSDLYERLKDDMIPDLNA